MRVAHIGEHGWRITGSAKVLGLTDSNLVRESGIAAARATIPLKNPLETEVEKLSSNSRTISREKSQILGEFVIGNEPYFSGYVATSFPDKSPST
jgi:hypothetical protein